MQLLKLVQSGTGPDEAWHSAGVCAGTYNKQGTEKAKGIVQQGERWQHGHDGPVRAQHQLVMPRPTGWCLCQADSLTGSSTSSGITHLLKPQAVCTQSIQSPFSHNWSKKYEGSWKRS